MKTRTYTKTETQIRCVYRAHGQAQIKSLRLAKTGAKTGAKTDWGQDWGQDWPSGGVDSPQVIRLVRFIRYAEELQLIATWPWQRLTSRSGVD